MINENSCKNKLKKKNNVFTDIYSNKSENEYIKYEKEMNHLIQRPIVKSKNNSKDIKLHDNKFKKENLAISKNKYNCKSFKDETFGNTSDIFRPNSSYIRYKNNVIDDNNALPKEDFNIKDFEIDNVNSKIDDNSKDIQKFNEEISDKKSEDSDR